jgi:ABC-type multidrug transport system ATPase subunit
VQRRLLRLSPSSVEDAIVRLGLGAYATRRAGHLSLGNKQRLAIARAMLHRPELLVLDEPVNGLDPAGIVEIRHLLRRLADEDGVTVFLSSHLLSEIAHLADRICIIHEGRIVDDLDRAELHMRSRRGLELVVSDARRASSLLASELQINDVEYAGDGVLRVFAGTEHAAAVTRMLVEHDVEVSQIVHREEDLEEYFMRLTGGAS